MLTPTRIYVKSFLSLYERFDIHGAANITGGGFHENIPRMLRAGLRAVLKYGSWEVPPIFDLIQRMGPDEDREMESTFNMGLGMVLAVPAAQAAAITNAAKELGEKAWVVGEVTAGEVGVEVLRS
jgi:phosphoribosylformylglycinamidine cyclo-ligase